MALKRITKWVSGDGKEHLDRKSAAEHDTSLAVTKGLTELIEASTGEFTSPEFKVIDRAIAIICANRKSAIAVLQGKSKKAAKKTKHKPAKTPCPTSTK